MDTNVVTPLRPAAPAPARKPDPTAPIRQRRHRAKVKTATVTSRAVTPPPVQPKKPSETKATVTPPRRHNAAAKALRRQTVTAAGVGLVAVILTALSLSHLAHGIGIVTHADAWEA